MRFDNFLDSKNDNIDNTAYNLLCLLATADSEVSEIESPELDWDMQIIGTLVDYAEELIRGRKIEPCRPFFEGDEEIPCFLGKDCKRKDCLFRKDKENA